MTELQARVSGRIRLFYGIGSVAEGIKDTAFSVFLLFFYNQVLGLSGSLAGLAILIALLFDAVSDPLLGALVKLRVSPSRTTFSRRPPARTSDHTGRHARDARRSTRT